MKLPQIKRTYEGFVVNPPKALEETYNFYHKAASFLFEEWLKLLGGFSKGHAPKHLKQNLDKICFSFWFTPVLQAKHKKDFIVSPEELRSKFIAYWGDDSISKELDLVFETASSLKKDVVWIDRHAQFKADNNKSSDLDPLFFDPEFVFFKKKKSDDKGGDKESENSNQYVGSLISRYWNTGKKTDFSEVVSFLEQFESKIAVGVCLKDIIPIEDYETKLLNWSKDGIEGKHPVVVKMRSCLGDKKGKASSLMLRVKDRYNKLLSIEDCGKIKEAIKAELDKADVRTTYPDFPYFNKLMQNLMKYLGVSNSDLSHKYICDIFSMVIPGYRSWRSNFLRQIENRQKNYTLFENFNIKEKLDSDVYEKINSFKESNNQKYLRNAQFRGIKRLLAYWEHDKLNPTKPLDDENYFEQWGDKELLQMLSDILPKKKNPKEIIDTIISYENAHSQYIEMFHPYINMKDLQNPRIDSAKILFDSKIENYSNARYMDIDLFENGNFTSCKLKLASGRLFREVNFNADSLKGGRMTRLMSSIYGNAVSSVNLNPISMQLLKKSGRNKTRWYFKVSVTLPERSPIKEYADAFKEKEGVPVMGTDLGMKEPVSFMLFETIKVENPESLKDNEVVTFVNEKRASEKLYLKIVEYGSLKDNHLPRTSAKSVRIGKLRTVSRLFDNSTIKPTVDDVALWNEKIQLSKWKNKKSEIPQTRVAFAKKLSELALHLARVLVPSEAEKHIGEIHHALSGRFPKGSEENRYGLGGLSFIRLETLNNLKSAYQAVNSNYEKFGKDNRKFSIDIKVKKLFDRIKAIRLERVRVIVNLILRKAIDSGVKLIAIENLEGKTSQSNDRRFNKRIVNWCANRIGKELEQHAKELGIVVKKVYAPGTSMEDLFLKEWRPRFSKHTEASFENSVKFLEKNIKEGSGIRADLNKKWYEFKKGKESLSVVLQQELKEYGHVLLPKLYGDFFPSSRLGWINSDVHASGVIALRGLRLLLGWFREREVDENENDQNFNHKPKANNKLSAKDTNRNHSQDVSPVPPLTWAISNEIDSLIKGVSWAPSRDSNDKLLTVNKLC